MADITTWAGVIGWARKAAGKDDVAIAEEAAAKALEQAKEAAAKAAAVAETGTPTVRAEGDKKQALLDALYLVANADGQVTDEERGKISAAVSTIIGESDAGSITSGLEAARVFVQEHGAVTLTETIAKTVPEQDGRSSILVFASAVAWLGRGVGTKEGLVLQALARAFGVPLTDLHKLMAVGKIV